MLRRLLRREQSALEVLLSRRGSSLDRLLRADTSVVDAVLGVDASVVGSVLRAVRSALRALSRRVDGRLRGAFRIARGGLCRAPPARAGTLGLLRLLVRKVADLGDLAAGELLLALDLGGRSRGERLALGLQLPRLRLGFRLGVIDLRSTPAPPALALQQKSEQGSRAFRGQR